MELVILDILLNVASLVIFKSFKLIYCWGTIKYVDHANFYKRAMWHKLGKDDKSQDGKFKNANFSLMIDAWRICVKFMLRWKCRLSCLIVLCWLAGTLPLFTCDLFQWKDQVTPLPLAGGSQLNGFWPSVTRFYCSDRLLIYQILDRKLLPNFVS